MADELKRRLVHASGSGLVGLYLLLGRYLEVLSWRGFQALMVGLTVAILVLEFFRLRVGLEWWVYEELTREYEQEKIAGYALYIISMTAVVLVFEWYVALPAMLMLALGDPISGTFSSNSLERIKPPRVLISMFVVSALLGVLFLPPAAAVAAALGATVADGVTLRPRGYVIDDNLTIPVFAAVAAVAVLALV